MKNLTKILAALASLATIVATIYSVAAYYKSSKQNISFLPDEKTSIEPQKSEPVISTEKKDGNIHSVKRTPPVPQESDSVILVKKDSETIPDKQSQYFNLTINAIAGAEIWVDGVNRGTNSVSLDITVGEHTITVKKDSLLWRTRRVFTHDAFINITQKEMKVDK